VNAVVLYVRPEELAYGPFLRFGGIGRAHHRAPPVYGVIRFQNQHPAWTRAHEVGQGFKERLVPVDAIEPLCLVLRHAYQLSRNDPEPLGLYPLYDLADQSPLYGVGLYDSERSL